MPTRLPMLTALVVVMSVTPQEEVHTPDLLAWGLSLSRPSSSLAGPGGHIPEVDHRSRSSRLLVVGGRATRFRRGSQLHLGDRNGQVSQTA